MFQIPRKNNRRGFTLMEVLAVIAIIAVVALIAVPSFMSSRRSMAFTQRNDYARSIYIAAQTHLTDLRSKGGLDTLPTNPKGTIKQLANTGPTSKEQNPNGYVYTHSADASIYNAVLPVNSIDATLRDQQVIIEYNPINGSVYSVFYSEEEIANLYSSGQLPRDEAARKEMLLGYYDGSDLSPTELDIYRVAAEISYENGEEGIVTLQFPVQAKNESGTNVNIFDENEGADGYFKNRLEIALTVTGESNNGSFTKLITTKDNSDIKISQITVAGAVPVLEITFPLDSFGKDTHSQSQGFKDLATACGNQDVLIGDNITLTADLTFVPDSNDPVILIESASIAGINPLFHSLTQNPGYDPSDETDDAEKKYILAVSNGRNLQNLNALDTALLSQVDSIIFTRQDAAAPAAEGTEFVLDWETSTASYYKAKYSTQFEHGLTFKPIDLSGTANKALDIIGNGITIRKLDIDNTCNNTNGNMGLFGSLKHASVEGITVEDVTIGGGDVTANNKYSAGALIGYASNVTVKNCYSSNVRILPSQNNSYAYEGVGGLIGLSADTSVNSCSVSNISFEVLPATGEGSTYKATENLGGMIGLSRGSSFQSVNVNLTDIPKYADDAGLFAGYVSGRLDEYSVNNLRVQLNDESADTSVTVARLGGAVGQAHYMDMNDVYIKLADGTSFQANGNAAGAVAIVQGGNLTDIHVVAEGSCYITADLAAGFATVSSGTITGCFVLPPQENSTDNRTYNIEKISITGIQAAGFVVTNESSISDSIGLAKVTATNQQDKDLVPAAAGFVVTNGGTIEKCFSNASVENGAAFVHNNTNTVQNCYGWASSTAALPLENCGTYKSSYFALRGISEGTFVVLYDHTGAKSNDITHTDALLDELALKFLIDPNADPIWEQKTDAPYPYPYLKSQLHPIPQPKGEWDEPTGGNYSYGVLYYEKYSEDDWGLAVTDLSAAPISYTNDLDDTATTTYGYALYCRTGKQADLTKDSGASATEWAQSEESDLLKKLGLSELYSVYQLKANSDGNVTIGNKSMNLLYAPDYAIRQVGQFQNIGKNPGQKFQITRSLDLGSNSTISSFSGTLTDSGDITITADNTLVNTLTGHLENLNVTVKNPMVGTISGNGTISGCTVSGTITASGGNVGVLAGTMESGTIENCTVSGSISGSADNIGGVVGLVNGGEISSTNSTVTVPANAHPFANFAVVTFDDVTHQNNSSSAYKSDYYPIGSVPLSDINKYPVSPVCYASVSNCSYQDSSGTHNSSCDTYHFYHVKEHDKFEPGDLAVHFEKAAVTYDMLGTPAEWTETNYFQQNSEGGVKYLPVYVKCTVTPVESDDPTQPTNSTEPTGTEADISTTAEATTTYTFEFSTNSNGSEAITVETTSLSSNVSIELYQLSGDLPTSGTYQLTFGDQVFYCTSGGTSWDSSDSITPFTLSIWEVDAGKWTNLDTGMEITVSLNTSGGTAAAKIQEATNGDCDIRAVTVYHYLTHKGSAQSILWRSNAD